MENNKNNGNVSWATIFGVAAVWFGSHVGGGFATGNQTRTFFGQFGFPAIFMPFIAVILIGLVYHQGLHYARNIDEYNYRKLFESFYAPFGKFGGIFFDIAYFFLAIVGVGTSIAGAASLFDDLFGMNYLVGVLITGTVFFLLTIFGAGLVRKASSLITILILIFLTIITVVGIKANVAELSSLFVTKQTTAPMGTVIWNAMKYVGYQSLVFAIVLGSGTPLKTRESINRFTFLGILLNGIMITLSTLMLLAWLPLIKEETLPILTIIKQLDNKFLLIAYSTTLLLAFVSTGVGCIFGLVARYENQFRFGTLTQRRMLLSLVSMLISMSISLVGLNTLVLKGYGYIGVFSVFLFVIPVLVIGIIKNRSFKK